MNKNKKWSRIIIGSMLVLILAIGGTAVLAQAQDDPEVTPPAEESETFTFPNPFARGDFQGHRGFHGRPDGAAADEYLADALGITVEELQATQEAVRAAALEQAVADGLLTQEQADQLSQFDGRFHGGHFGLADNKDELLAAELGITVEALQTAQEEAHQARLDQLVADGVITQEQADLMAARKAVNDYLDVEGLSDAAQAAYETAVQQALDAGEITQDQADQLLSEASGFGGRGFFGGRGGFGHGGRHGRGFPGFPNAAPDTTTTNDA